MPKHSKRFAALQGKVDNNKNYAPDEALGVIKECANAKFDETVEVHLRMGVDPRHADQQVRGVVTLPNGTGRTVRILVFANPEGQTLAREAGADFVGAENLADEIMKGWTDFDVVLATPDMMRVVGRLGKVLGPRGLMPSPKTGTIIPAEELPRVINESRLGRVEFRVDKTSNIHVPIGKASFPQEKLLQNFAALMEALVAAKPTTLKGNYIHRVTLASTMGPGVKADIAAASALKSAEVAA
ncbi:50S ribosomal protein L1 [Caldilinea sp.]|uniref:50S ribosomal protein L1 n=1 Tax=Caldilinea sp. TaxID=2293560 RepID=UPI002B63DCEC|nr:50S ribosomal protein L1 [Caldilinea sp.]